DVNDLVMQGALLILFPPTPSCGYVRPDVNRVNERLEELIELGFDLTYNVIGDIMQLFENRLSDVGGIFLESFVKIKGITVKELLEKILIESIKPERNLKKFELWNFLNIHLEKIYDEDFNEEAKKLRSKIEYQEDAFMKAMTEYMEHTSESNITNNPDNEDDTEDAPKKFITSLKLLPKFYSWILKIFGANAEITKVCFDDILKTRVSINEQLIQDLNSELPPNGWTKCSYEATVNIWKIFCNSG
ncbi:2916_t:CDS:1, partial [Acaulospora morrowiae]